jgi:peptidoglycan-N-acetylglucosamine deacetylase
VSGSPEHFAWPNGRRGAFSLSFDDARLSQIDQGMEILDAHGLKATFFVQIGPLQQRLEQWRRVIAGGHEIGNHTLTHPCSGNFRFSRTNALEDYTLERIEQDILAANQQIEALLGVVPQTFAYPCGQTYVGRGVNLRSYVPVVALALHRGEVGIRRGAESSADLRSGAGIRHRRRRSELREAQGEHRHGHP